MAPTEEQQQQRKNITIIGGGIIGCSTAYYLTRHPSYNPQLHRITLLEAASSSSAGGRTRDSLQDPAELAYPTDTNSHASDGNNMGNAEAVASQALKKEHDGIAGGASGKAGGLLALWAFPSNIVPLSFRLHEELAAEHGGRTRWGYRRCWASQVECEARLQSSSSSSESLAGGSGGESVERENSAGNTKGLHKDHKTPAAALRRKRIAGAPEDLDWVLADGWKGYENIGTPENTAQVHPELFTRSMAALAEEAGVSIVTGARVTGIEYTKGENAKGMEREEVESVTYLRKGKDGEEGEQEVKLETTDCVIAAGPWTERILPGIPVTASRAHSVVIQTPRPVSAYALFTAIGLPKGFPAPSVEGSGSCKTSGKADKEKEKEVLKRPTTVEPEIYARPDGTAYACGPTDTDVSLPLTTEGVEVDEGRCGDILKQVGGISDELDTFGTSGGDGGKVLAKQACYLPQGGPWIGPVPGKRGVVVAAGHTCWGIQNAPGTGKVVSEIVLEGRARSAKLGGCDPARVM